MLAVVLGSMFFALLTVCMVFGPCGHKKYFANEGWGGNGAPVNPRRVCPHDPDYSYRLDMSVGKDGKVKYRERFVPVTGG